mgnify:CR=1 FL=1
MKKIFIGCLFLFNFIFANNVEYKELNKKEIVEDLGIQICSKEKIEKNEDCVENSNMSMDNDGEEFENETLEKEDKNEK